MKLSYTPEAPSGTADLRRPAGWHRRPQSLFGRSFLHDFAAERYPESKEKITSKWSKKRCLGGQGAVLGTIWVHFRSKLFLEAILAHFGRPWKAENGAKMGPRSAKMGQVAAKMAASCDQKAPRSTQERLVGALLRASSPILELFGGHLCEKTGKRKTFKNRRFLKVFATLGGPAGHLLDATLADVGLNLGVFLAFWAVAGAC